MSQTPNAASSRCCSATSWARSGLPANFDPEDLREVVRAYQEACPKVIAHYEGHIARYLGDGLLVCFGYLLAHEWERGKRRRTSSIAETPNGTVRQSAARHVRLVRTSGIITVG
jgi:class 3 adenylate cyclase